MIEEILKLMNYLNLKDSRFILSKLQEQIRLLEKREQLIRQLNSFK